MRRYTEQWEAGASGAAGTFRNTCTSAPTVPLADDHAAGIGDRIPTRRNDRRLPVGRHDWVKNGDAWTVRQIHPDGSVTARSDRRAGTVRLPADYVTDHVELGYATTPGVGVRHADHERRWHRLHCAGRF